MNLNLSKDDDVLKDNIRTFIQSLIKECFSDIKSTEKIPVPEIKFSSRMTRTLGNVNSMHPSPTITLSRELLDSKDALANVIAHEMVHVVQGHLSRTTGKCHMDRKARRKKVLFNGERATFKQAHGENFHNIADIINKSKPWFGKISSEHTDEQPDFAGKYRHILMFKLNKGSVVGFTSSSEFTDENISRLSHLIVHRFKRDFNEVVSGQSNHEYTKSFIKVRSDGELSKNSRLKSLKGFVIDAVESSDFKLNKTYNDDDIEKLMKEYGNYRFVVSMKRFSESVYVAAQSFDPEKVNPEGIYKYLSQLDDIPYRVSLSFEEGELSSLISVSDFSKFVDNKEKYNEAIRSRDYDRMVTRDHQKLLEFTDFEIYSLINNPEKDFHGKLADFISDNKRNIARQLETEIVKPKEEIASKPKEDKRIKKEITTNMAFDF